MRRDDQDGRGRFTAGAALRQAAIAERPPFSERFHGRLLERLPTARSPRPAPRAVAAMSAPVAPLVRRAVVPLAFSAAVVAVAVLLLAGPARELVPAGQSRPLPASEAAMVAVPAAAADGLAVTVATLPEEPLGIDRLPTPGEIEAEVREGVTTLAVSLLEMPDWTALADFDAGAVFGDGGR